MQPPDQQQRRQAIDPQRSFIIQAPAGSGKTELLTQRYLRLLALVDSPEEIIAVTFTRKAAGEMQSRILTAIKAVKTGRPPQSPHQRQTWELARRVLTQDQQQNWELSDNPVRLRVQTIDSLCAGLAKQMPMLSRLGTQPEIVDDAEPLYQQAAINTLAELETDADYADEIACLLSHLDNDLQRITGLIVEMLKKRDQWLHHVTQTQVRTELEQSLKNAIEEQLGDLIAVFPRAVEAELCDILRFAAGNLIRENNVAEPVHHESATLPGQQAEDLGQWLSIAALLLTGDDTWRKSFNKRNGFPAPRDNPQKSKERADMKQRIADLSAQLQQVDGLRDRLAAIKALPPARYDDNEWQMVRALCTCLKVAAAQLRLCFAERNQIDYIGMAQAAIDALGEEDAPTDLALHLDYQIKHLLVDEFQDISINQYRLITQLTGAWGADEDRSLFLVGDPMQSIYRFRQAEVGLFMKTFQQRCLGQIPLTPLRLSVNFRSLPGIVAWVNDSFAGILPAQDDIAAGAVRYSPSIVQQDQAGAGGAVNPHPLFNHAGVKEARQVRNIIGTIRRDNPDAGIAILVRNRRHLNELVPQLRNHDLPFQAIEIDALGQRPAIQDILALTRAYIHPADRTAWLAVLRAPWCGLSLQDLHSLVNHESSSTIWPAITDPKRQQRLDQRAAARLQRLIKCFSAAFDARQRRPLRKIIETLWISLGGAAALTVENDLDNINTYFELLEQFDRGGEIDDPQRFMDKVQQLYAAPDKQSGNILQIMTIHKAKGLEFDHIILPGLGHVQKRGQTDLLKWTLKPNRRQGDDLILAPIKQAGETKPPIYQYLQHLEQKKQHYEEIRLLYVAATRARISLHLLGHAALKPNQNGDSHCSPAPHSLLHHLWPVLRQQYEAAMPKQIAADTANPGTTINNHLHRLHQDWRCPSPDPPIEWAGKHNATEAEPEYIAIEYQWAGETIRQIGMVVHQFLKQIAEQGADQWNAARIGQNNARFVTLLQQQGVPDQEIDWACGQIAEALSNTLRDERGRWILNDHKNQHNEYPLSGLFQGRLINAVIDRTFVDEDGVRWIIDYKTSRHEGPDMDTFLNHEQQRHRDQLTKYAGLMGAMDDGQIKLGLYFPLLRGWREWSP